MVMVDTVAAGAVRVMPVMVTEAMAKTMMMMMMMMMMRKSTYTDSKWENPSDLTSTCK